jgi:hypothetical protein
MKQFIAIFAAALAGAIPVSVSTANAQTPPAIPPSISTPDKVDSRLGPLEFKDGVPGKATAEKLYDNLDFTYAYRAFMDNLRGVSIHALHKGMQEHRREGQ